MKKNRLLFVSLVGLILPIATMAQTISISTKKPFHVSQLVTKETLLCNTADTNEKLIDFYWKLADIQGDFPNIQQKPFKIANYTVTGIKAISSQKLTDKDGITISKNMDVDIHKFGLHILRLSQYGYSPLTTSEGEGGGYYMVLKGLPEQNLEILKKLTNDKEPYFGIEKTAGNNTRLYCGLVG